MARKLRMDRRVKTSRSSWKRRIPRPTTVQSALTDLPVGAELPDFEDDPGRSNEKIWKTSRRWIEERNYPVPHWSRFDSLLVVVTGRGSS